MAYRVAIVDDSNIDAEYVQSILKDWAQDRQAGVQAQRFVSAENFLFHYADDKAWDILLLDIEMGTMDGVSLAKRIRKENELVQIVFITGFPDFMAEGYEVSALHYLMKFTLDDFNPNCCDCWKCASVSKIEHSFDKRNGRIFV